MNLRETRCVDLKVAPKGWRANDQWDTTNVNPFAFRVVLRVFGNEKARK